MRLGRHTTADVPRVFLDANILIRGCSFPRFPYQILAHAARGEIKIVLSPLVLAAARNYVTQLFPKSLPRLENLLALIPYELIDNPSPQEVEDNKGLVRDKEDVPVALAAINADVDYLISVDTDFTDRDATTETLRQKVNVLRPGRFLREVMGWTTEELGAISRRTWSDVADQISF